MASGIIAGIGLTGWAIAASFSSRHPTALGHRSDDGDRQETSERPSRRGGSRFARYAWLRSVDQVQIARLVVMSSEKDEET